MYVNINGYIQAFLHASLSFSTANRCIFLIFQQTEPSSVILSICIRRKLTYVHYLHVVLNILSNRRILGMSWYVILFALLAIACWLVHVWSRFGDSFGALIPRRLEDPAVAVAKSHVSCQCLVVPESPCRSCVRQTSWVIQVPFTIQINTIPRGFGQDDCIPCSIYGVGAWCQYKKCSS